MGRKGQGRGIRLPLAAMAVLLAMGFEPTSAAGPATRAAADAVKTIAILPFHCRAGPRHKDLVTAINLLSSGTLQGSGRAVVDRERVDRIFDEKDLAGADLSDKAALAAHGRTIGADLVVSGHYDVIDGTLTIAAALIPSGRSDFGRYRDKVDRRFERVQAEGPVEQAIAVIQRFAARLDQAVARLMPPPASRPASDQAAAVELGKDRALAIFDFAAAPVDEHTTGLARAMTDLLTVDMQEVLPLRIVERQKLHAILQEKKLALAGLTYRAQALRAARLVGADYILLGSLLHYGPAARLDVQVLDVATAALIAAVSRTGGYEELLRLHQQLAAEVAGRLGAGLQQVRWLTQRKTGKSVEAVTQAWRAHRTLFRSRLPGEQRNREARRLMQLALDLDDANPTVLRLAGDLEWTWRNHERAERYFRHALKLDPQCARSNYSLSRFLLDQRKDATQALPFARRAVELSPPRLSLYRAQLVRCLLKAGRLDEAEAAGRKALAELGRSHDHRLYESVGEVMEAREKHAEAAEMYEKAVLYYSRWRAAWMWIRARKAYERAGNRKKAMEMLQKQMRTSKMYLEDIPKLAEYLAESDPVRAAAMCYNILAEPKLRGDWEKARALLREMDAPAEPPIITGPVFDIEPLRKKGVRIFLQPYEGFRYTRHLPYLKAYIEDVLGVPVAYSTRPRPMVEANYYRAVDRLEPSDECYRDLAAVRRQQRAVTVVGLLSTRIRAEWVGVFWPRQGLVSSQKFDRYFSEKTSLASEALATMTFHHFQRMVLKYAAMGLPSQRPDSGTHCQARLCVCSTWRWGYLNRIPVPCADCRRTLQCAGKDWPKGPLQRPPIQAGPAGAVLPNDRRKVILLTLGLSAEEAHARQVAQAVEASLGFRVEVVERPQMPDLPRRDGKCELGDLQRCVSSAVRPDGDTLAVCAVTGACVRGSPYTSRSWAMYTHEKKGIRRHAGCATVIIPLFTDGPAPMWGVLQELRQLEDVSLPAGAKSRTVRVPQYGKLVVAALSHVTRKHLQCWTYGCPATLWTVTGIPHRCSYWLCPECRKAMAAYYHGKATSRPVHDEYSTASK